MILDNNVCISWKNKIELISLKTETLIYKIYFLYLFLNIFFMRNTKSAFTLVELIVVITILAILGTIAFISLQGYSADARNSKRTSDINNIVSKMNIQNTEGVDLVSFVADSSAELSSASIAGTGTTIDDYKAGQPNYTVLGIKADDFKDPSDEVAYPVGVTTKKSGQFEVAATMENGAGEEEAKLVGTYKSRGLASITGAVSDDGLTITVAAGDLNTFFKGDTITVNSTDTTTIKKVSADLATLTLDSTVTSTGADYTVELADTEEDGLIDSTNTGTPVTAGSTTNLPY